MPGWIPEPLRDPRRAIPAAVALLVLIGAAVYLPSRSTKTHTTATTVAGDNGDTTQGGSTGETSRNGGSSSTGNTSSTGTLQGGRKTTRGVSQAAPPGFHGSGTSGRINR